MGTRTRAVAAATIGLLLLAGCSDDGEPGADPTPSSTPSETPTETPTDSGSPTDEPTESEPTVEPATGPEARMSQYTVRAPDGWRAASKSGPWVEFELLPKGSGIGKQAYGVIALTSFPSVEAKTLDQEARDQAGGKRQDDVVIAGEPAFHVVRPESGPYTSETFGLNRDFTSVAFDFSLFGGSEQQRQDVIASVLASVEWR